MLLSLFQFIVRVQERTYEETVCCRGYQGDDCDEREFVPFGYVSMNTLYEQQYISYICVIQGSICFSHNVIMNQ